MNDLTTRLNHQLHDQVDDLHGAPLTLESVRGRAHAIRRTRRMAVAGVAAVAVAAIAVPTALLGDSAGRSDRSPQPIEPPSEAVDSNKSVTESPLDIPYVEGRRLVLPDGTRARLPETYLGVTVVGQDTVYGLRSDDESGQQSLDVLDGDMEVTETIPIASGVATDADSTAITYVRADGELVVRTTDAEVALGEHGAIAPVRLIGDPTCGEGDASCIVLFNREGEQPPAAVASFDKVPFDLDGRPLVLNDVPEDSRYAAQTESRPDGSCSQVYDTSTGPVFRTCDYSLSRFSPGGDHHLSATDDYRDGLGQRWVAVLDRDGNEVTRYEPGDDAFLRSWVWEDSTHLLVLHYAAGEWRVVRLGLDGSTETALGPSGQGDEVSPPYSLVGPS